MKILTVNANINSIHFGLYEMDNCSLVVSFFFDRIGLDDSYYTINNGKEIIREDVLLVDHLETVKILLDKLISLGVISSFSDIKCISHRILHGGSLYSDSVIIDAKVINNLESISNYAPYYNNGGISTINAFRQLLSDCLMVCVFDTSFNQTMDVDTYLYPVPHKWYVEYGIRKYGFCGLSHKDVMLKVKELLGKKSFKLINCYIDNNCSICCIDNMKCIDNSMGFSPISGVMGDTNSGDIDPSIIPYVMVKEGKNAAEILDDLTNNSGLFGICEYSGDINEIYDNLDDVDKRVVVSKNKFVRRIVDYISQYYVLLNGVDVITFSGDVLINNVSLRREICEKLKCLGISIDLDINSKSHDMAKISTKESLIDVYVIPTNEDLMVARDALSLINR